MTMIMITTTRLLKWTSDRWIVFHKLAQCYYYCYFLNSTLWNKDSEIIYKKAVKND